jgi:hypothetical protein
VPFPSGADIRRRTSDHLHDGGRAEVELVQQQGVGVDCLQAIPAERAGGEDADIGGDDGLRASPNGCRDNMPVIVVGRMIPGSSSSHPLTRASSNAAFMPAKRLFTSMPGWISSMASRASVRMRWDHSGRYRPLFSHTK